MCIDRCTIDFGTDIKWKTLLATVHTIQDLVFEGRFCEVMVNDFTWRVNFSKLKERQLCCFGRKKNLRGATTVEVDILGSV